MAKSKTKRLVPLAFLLFPSLLFVSCANYVPQALSMEEWTNITNYAITEPAFAEGAANADAGKSQNTKYIFARLYNVTYKPSRPWGKVLNKFVDIFSVGPDGIPYEHSAISYKLSDEFYSLTSQTKNAVKKEEVTNTSRNAYMVNNNEELSYCTVLAIPCTETDYENCKKLIDFAYDNSTTFRYSILGVARTPAIRSSNIRKFVRHKDKPDPDCAEPALIDNAESCFPRRKFSCSAFCANILMNGVQRFKSVMEKMKFNPRGTTPADLFYFGDAQKLFTCRYTEYDEALQQFIEAYPQFEEYL